MAEQSQRERDLSVATNCIHVLDVGHEGFAVDVKRTKNAIADAIRNARDEQVREHGTRAQGLRPDYDIRPTFEGKPLTKTKQIELCGNSVCRQVAAAIVRANASAVRSAVA
jgi:hypothetical protein